jgi:hypothetical protein
VLGYFQEKLAVVFGTVHAGELIIPSVVRMPPSSGQKV